MRAVFEIIRDQMELKLQKKPNKTYCYLNDLGHLFPTDGTYL